MKRIARNWTRRFIMLVMGAWILQAGCASLLTNELEVLFAAAANTTLIRGSTLANLFGPGLLRLFN